MIKNIKKILAALIIITIAAKSMAFLPDSVLDESTNLIQNTMVGLSGVDQEDFAETLKRNLKSKIVNTTENYINKEINNQIEKVTPGKTQFSIRNITSATPSIKFISIQPVTTITEESMDATLIQTSAENRTGTSGKDITFNAGIVKRYLSPDKTSIYGANAFLDYQRGPGHRRASIGLELKRKNFNLNYNKYYALSGDIVVGKYKEKVMPGEEIRITGQVPYVPWSKVTYNKYRWIKPDGKDERGHRVGLNVDLSKSTTLRMSRDLNGNGTSSITLRFNLPYGDPEKDKKTDFSLSKDMFEKTGTLSLTDIDFVNRADRIKVSKTLDGNDVEIGVFNSTTVSSVCTLKTDDGAPVLDVHGKEIVGTTNSEGIVKFNNVMIPSAIVVVECYGGNYIDEATGANKTVTMQTSAKEAFTDTNLNIYVTPISDIIHKIANEDGNLADLDATREMVEESFGLSTTLVKPDDLNLVEASSTAAGEYGLVLAAISQVSKTDQTTPEETIEILKESIKDTGALPPNKITSAIRELAENPTAPAAKNIQANLEVIKKIQSKIPEVQAFIITKIEKELTEGQTVEYFIKITTEPAEYVTLSIQATDNITVVPELLKLTPDNWWKEDNKVTITVNEDLDAIDEVAKITHLVTSKEYEEVEALASTITIFDNDIASIAVSAVSGNTSEAGTTATFTMILTSEPTADVVIPVSSSDITEGSVSVKEVKFTSVNWNTAQTVTITGIDDDVQDGDIDYKVVLAAAVSSDPSYNGINKPDISLSNQDNNIAKIMVSAVSGNTSEAGTTATFTMTLGSEPIADVVIPVSSTDTTEGSISVTEIKFTSANWNAAQTVTITGADDQVNDGDINYKVVFGTAVSTDSNYKGLVLSDISVVNTDNDMANIIVSAVSGDTSEAGATATFTIVLDSEPTADVVIPVISSDITEGTVSITEVKFTTVNWNTAQTVTITGIDDDVQDGDINYRVILPAAVSTDPKYSGINVSDKLLDNIDNDAANIIVSAVSGDTSEAGTTATFTVVLTSEPTTNVVIPVSSSDITEGTVSLPQLTFTPSNWNAPQTITITGVDDDVQDSDLNYNVVLGAAVSTDPIYNGINKADINLSNQDNDTANIVVSSISGSTSESGATATFTIVLTSEPTANVLIPVSSTDITEGSVSVTNITFTPLNWNAPQTVIITGMDDEVQDSDINYNVILGAAVSADPRYNNIDKADINLDNQDNDTANIIVSSITGSTSESGAAATFTIVLTSEPTANVVIAVSSSDTTEGAVSLPQLTFTPSNWNAPQTITITGVDDDVQDSDINYNVVLGAAVSTDPSYNGIQKADINLANQDNDTANIIVSSISGSTTESGATATFTIVLTSEPTADVVIPVSSSDITEGSISVSEITFTPTNWNSTQTITITGLDDEVQDSDVNYNIVLGLSVSTDPSYNGIQKADINLDNQDNDIANLIVSTITGGTTEAGSTASFTMVLTSEPTADVVIPVSSSVITEGTVSVSSVTFTPANWDLLQTITVTGIDDEIQDGDISYNIVLGASISSDPSYNAIDKADINLINQDNDVANILISAISGATTEAGTTAWVTVVLTTEPTGDVVMPVSSSDITEGAVAQSSITFTTSNWDTVQTIVVAGLDDAVQDSDINYNIVFGTTVSTDGNYNSMEFSDIAVVNTDDDVANVTVSSISGNTEENGTPATFSVVLTSEPTANVVIPVVSSDTTEGSITITEITFTPTNWNIPQIITITGVDDAELDADMGYSIILGNPVSSDPIYAAKTINDVNLNNLNDDFQISSATLIAMIANDEDITQVDTSAITDMSSLFSYNGTFNQDISGWDVSSVTSMKNMFKGASAFNQDISGWDVSNVTNMSAMFESNYVFDQDLSGWDVSSVTSMRNMFRSMYAFNADISAWDTSNVTDMSSMFYSNYSFDSDISNWNVANVTWSGQDSFNTQAILKCYNTPVFTGTTRIGCYPPEIQASTISGSTSEAGSTATFTVVLSSEPRWDVTIPVASSDTTEGSVTVTELTFTPIDWFVSQTVTVTGVDDAIVDGDISYDIVLGSSASTDPDYDNVTVNVAVVNTNYEIPETNQTLIDRIANGEDVSAANTSQVTSMNQLFASNTTFNQDISGWDTSSVTDMYGMFYGASSFNYDISGWDTSSVTNMEKMFAYSGSQPHDISSWDVSSVTNMVSMFEGNSSVGVNMSAWDTGSVTSMRNMFYKAYYFNSDISGWDTSSVTTMGGMFSRANNFNQDISAWNTSSVTNMYQMFYEAYDFNSNIGNWNTSSVTSMVGLFQRARAFNQPIGSWNMSSVTDIKYIFMAADSFDQDLSGWDVSNVVQMAYAFYDAGVFNSPLDSWNVTGASDLKLMFSKATLFNQPIGSWDTSGITNMEGVFKDATGFNQDIGLWDTSSVTYMKDMFFGAGTFNQDISGWVVGNSTNMQNMFRSASSFNQDLSGWNVSNVSVIDYMFMSATTFNQNISGWNVGNVATSVGFNSGSPLTCDNMPLLPEASTGCSLGPSTATVTLSELQTMIAVGDDVTQVDTSTITDMNNLFYNNRTFNQAIGNWDTSAVTNMSNMFNGAYDFNQDISGWDTGSVTNMSNMFYEAYDFNSAINTWNVSNVTTMTYMFFNTLGFNQPIGSWNVSNVTNMHGMLRNSWKFNQDISAWDVSNVTTMEQMLWNATDFNQDISGWNVANVVSTSLFSDGTSQTCVNTPVFNTPICTPPPSTATVTRAELDVMIANGDDITQVDTSTITDMSSLFSNKQTFNQDLSGWDVSNVTDMSQMFYQALEYNQSMSSWDVSNVTDMSFMFINARKINQDISGWNVSSVTNMQHMFSSAYAFNQPLNSWDVSNVTNMSYMFEANSGFNQPLNLWNTAAVTDMTAMFSYSFANWIVFNQDISGWNVSNVTATTNFNNNAPLTCVNTPVFNTPICTVPPSTATVTRAELDVMIANGDDVTQVDTSTITDMSYLIYGNTTFNQDVSGWDVSSVTDMNSMFYNALVFNNNGVALNWGDTSSVTTMQNMFNGAKAFNQDISGWDTSAVTTLYQMFASADNFNQPIGAWNTSSVTSMQGMFANGGTFNQPIGAWDTSNVTIMYNMFYRLMSFDQPLNTWDASSVTNMGGMFYQASSFNQDISGWNVSNVTSTTNFNNYAPLTCANTPVFNTPICTVPPSTATVTRAELDVMIANGDDVTQVDTSTITDMSDLFSNHSTFNQAIGNWNTSSVTNMGKMFYQATDYNQPISNWDVSNVTDMSLMFYNARSFNQDISVWNTAAVTTMQHMFATAYAFNQPINSWDVSSVTNMSYMFSSNSGFNQPLNLWNTAAVTDMSSMFAYPYANWIVFNQDISGWNVGNVTSTTNFNQNAPLTCANTPVFNTPICTPPPSTATVTRAELDVMIANGDDVTQVDTSTITDMSYLFDGNTTFNQDIGGWDVSNVTTITNIFLNADVFNQDLSNWNTSNVTEIRGAFKGAKLFNSDVSTWDVSSVGDAYATFRNSGFNQDISSWDVSSFTNVDKWFLDGSPLEDPFAANCAKLPSAPYSWFNCVNSNDPVTNAEFDAITTNVNYWGYDLTQLNTSQVTDMSWALSYNTTFNQDISAWDTSNVTLMNSLFDGVTSFNKDISAWDVSSVTNMQQLFSNASSFNQDISSWDVSSLQNAAFMFYKANGFNQPLSLWNTISVTDMSNMFRTNLSFNQDISGWDVSNVTSTGLFVDGSSVLVCANIPVFNTPICTP